MPKVSKCTLFYLCCFLVAAASFLFTTVHAGAYNLDGYISFVKANSDQHCFARVKFGNKYQGIYIDQCGAGNVMVDLLTKAHSAHQKVRVTIEGDGEDYRTLYAVEYLEED